MILIHAGRRGSLLIAAVFFFCSFGSAHAAFTNAPNIDSIGTDNGGSVDAVAVDTTTGIEYVGGAFTYLGPTTGNSAVLDTATHAARASANRLINGEVDAIISDGAGGYYAGGRFSLDAVTFTGKCLIHILADGSIDTTVSSTLVNCASGGYVRALALDSVSNTLYIGGSFNTTVDGQSRLNLASINTTTGHVTTWNPTIASGNVKVNVFLLNGTTLYVGGQFNDNDLVAFDTGTGSQTSFAPAVSGAGSFDQVYALAISGTTLYVGGQFDTVHTVSRSRLAAVDTTTGVPTSWNPAPNANVYALALDSTTLYVGGGFSSIGGATRNELAAIDTTTGTASSWDPEPDGEVHALAFDGSTVYAGGFFGNVSSTQRKGLAAISKSTGALTSWDTETDLEVMALALDGTSLLMGGDFSSAGGAQRENLAAIDTTTNAITSWNPGADREVDDLLLHNGKLYAGGSFSVVNGLDRYGLVAFDTSTGSVTSWDPAADIDGRVYSLAALGQNIYVGGSFSLIGSSTRN